jgi:ATP-dependent protease ClpP protease subunit
MTMPTPEQNVINKVESCVSFEKRTLYVMGDVDDDLAYQVQVALEALDSTDGDIRIVLNSEGGEEQPGYAIYDAITMCRNKVIIEAYGSVMSIAAAIFQAADVRRISPNAVFMIHNGSVDTEGNVQQDAVLDLAEQIKKGAQRYYDILMRGSGQPQDLIEQWCRDETFFSADETVSACFADEVIKPVKVKAPVKLKKRKRKANS